MRVTINGNVSLDVLKSILQTQKNKVEVIDDFYKENKLNDFYYEDNELEYEYIKTSNKKVR
jgi:hypothetical protein